jgi:hypothetical protein
MSSLGSRGEDLLYQIKVGRGRPPAAAILGQQRLGHVWPECDADQPETTAPTRQACGITFIEVLFALVIDKLLEPFATTEARQTG